MLQNQGSYRDLLPVRLRRVLGALSRSVRMNAKGTMLRYQSPLPAGHTGSVQILCLHHKRHRESELCDFVAWLRLSYELISYSEAIERITQSRFDECALALAFDDGLVSQYHAAHTLSRLGVSACFFVCPGVIGERPEISNEAFFRDRLMIRPQGIMSWDQLRELRSLGHEVGSHTCTHPNLALVDGALARHELSHSKQWIEREIGLCDHFAWPYGTPAAISEELLDFGELLGYRSMASAIAGRYGPGGCTLSIRPWIRRVPLECHWPRRSLRAMLRSCG